MGKIIEIDEKECIGCGSCVEICPNSAMSIVGKKMTVEDAVKEVLKDEILYHRGGGGTCISGGEPTMQDVFTTEFLKQCQDHFRTPFYFQDHFLPKPSFTQCTSDLYNAPQPPPSEKGSVSYELSRLTTLTVRHKECLSSNELSPSSLRVNILPWTLRTGDLKRFVLQREQKNLGQKSE